MKLTKSVSHQITISEALDAVNSIANKEHPLASAYGRGDCKMLVAIFCGQTPTYKVYGHGIVTDATKSLEQAVEAYNAVPLRSNDDAQG